MATATRMTPEEHKEIFQTMSESIVAEPEAPQKEQDIDPRALRGALHLDEHHPGWANKINLRIFDINDSNLCVVGQVFGFYDEHVSRAFNLKAENEEAEINYGVMPLYDEGDDAKELNRSWKILIAERQNGGGA